ncbi:MAG: hypothetical protein DRJ42_13350 [Deltaproteobacteria bacterium]|nr:MAG: hypothetical protein DRJ42_13350 [Deltaproteobacteria bacterium]
MRIRGYRLAFAEGNEYFGPVFTLAAIRGDATVPGVVYELDAICVDVLVEMYGAAEYHLTEVHLEAITPGRGGATVPAMAFMLERESTQTAATPREIDLTNLRAVWQNWGLDTGAIDHAFENP